MGLSFTNAAGPRQLSHPWVRVPRDSWPYFTVSDSRLPNLEGQVHLFISPRNRVAQLYPQTLGSLFVASYDSQGYGAGDLHRGVVSPLFLSSSLLKSSIFQEIFFPFVWTTIGNVLYGVLIAHCGAVQPSATGHTCCSKLDLFTLLSGHQICFVEAETYFSSH
jgi:hypothetical protein